MISHWVTRELDGSISPHGSSSMAVELCLDFRSPLAIKCLHVVESRLIVSTTERDVILVS